MTKVAFQLRRRPADHPAVALLLPAGDVAGLLGLCARLGLDPSGRVFAVEDGLLLKLERPTDSAFPGAVRLRGLATDFLLPVDADLIPALLDDEAEGLVRDRGLLMLPGGPALAFDPRTPLPLASLLSTDVRPRRAWRSLPEPEPLADRIEEIFVELPGRAGDEPRGESESPDDLPEGAADAVLEAGGEGIGSESPRPKQSDPASALFGRAAMGAGRALMGLGRALGMEGLAGVGAGWVKGAMGLAPRLGESIFGRQAAALRELLREFREGDPDLALRHALPLGEPGGARGAVPDADDRLPTHDLAYSLGKILGASDRGPARVWMGGDEVLVELTREYRRAAERALNRGDYRRAAFIYARLLRDYRGAAHALLKGGLHRDAAVLFLAKLDDPKSAARAFEEAGETDRAVALYRRAGEHEAAGDLLRRIGDEEAALTEYRLAADRLVANGRGHLAAGELLLTKAGRADLALEHFRAGWALRPSANALPCALRLARFHAEAGDPEALLGLIDEADEFFTPAGNDPPAAHFYNEMARLADSPGLTPARDDLRDRALLGLAAKLRQHGRAGERPGAVSTLLAESGGWPAAVVRDADFALSSAIARAGGKPRPSLGGKPLGTVRVGEGGVTAACDAPRSGEVFIGFEGGAVVCLRVATSEVVLVADHDLPVAALAAEPGGRSLAVLRADRHGNGALSTYARRPGGSYRLLLGTALDGLASPWLTPILPRPGADLIGLWDGQGIYVMEVASLTSRGYIELPAAADPPAGLLIPWPFGAGEGYGLLTHDDSGWSLFDPEVWRPQESIGIPWRPRPPVGGTLRAAPVSSAWVDRENIEMAWLGDYGTLFWTALRFNNGVETVRLGTSGQRGGYRATAIVRPGVVAGVSRSGFDRYLGGSGGLQLLRSEPIGFDSVAACFSCWRTGELVVVGGDGLVRRVPVDG